MTREEAYKEAWNHCDSELEHSFITAMLDKVYNSIGSCSECKHWEEFKMINNGAGMCTSIDGGPETCELFFCADFERKED